MSICVVAGVVSPLRGDVVSLMESLGFSTVTERTVGKVRAHLYGEHKDEISALIVLDIEQKRNGKVFLHLESDWLRPEPENTVDAIIIDSVRADFDSFLLDSTKIRPKTLVITDGDPKWVEYTVLKTTDVSYDRLKAIFGRTLPRSAEKAA